MTISVEETSGAEANVGRKGAVHHPTRRDVNDQYLAVRFGPEQVTCRRQLLTER